MSSIEQLLKVHVDLEIQLAKSIDELTMQNAAKDKEIAELKAKLPLKEPLKVVGD